MKKIHKFLEASEGSKLAGEGAERDHWWARLFEVYESLAASGLLSWSFLCTRYLGPWSLEPLGAGNPASLPGC